MNANEVFHFGYLQGYGHGLFKPGMRWAPHLTSLPWKQLDGVLCPKGKQVQGLGAIHHLDGWTAWAFWDRTGDARLNSNSAFFATGEHDFETMMAIAAGWFPDVYARVSGAGLEVVGRPGGEG